MLTGRSQVGIQQSAKPADIEIEVMTMTSIEEDALIQEAERLVEKTLQARDRALDELVAAHLAYDHALEALCDLELKS
jgi:hypothetical protein